VNDSPDRLAANGFQGRPASIPVSGLPASTVDAALRPALEKSEYTAWDPMGYLILCLAQVIRMRAGSFVRLGTVQDSVQRLKSKFPLAVEAALAQADVYSLTRILRGLVESFVPIRDLQSIVERIADREYCATDAAALTVLEEGYPALASQEGVPPLEAWLWFVKRGLSRPAPAP
jgi:flagellar biosynthesis component FlhA